KSKKLLMLRLFTATKRLFGGISDSGRISGAESGQCRSGLQARGKVADERLHRGMPETVETEEVHFVHGLLGGPAVQSHAIGGDKNACAIITKAAMHKDFLTGMIAEQCKKLRDLLVGWRRPATHGNVHEMNAERFSLLAFPGDAIGIFAA